MCNPAVIPYVVMAVAAVGTAAYDANQRKIAVERQMKVQQEQVDDGAAAAMNDRIKAAREQRAAARAASAESGASGNSTDAILNDMLMQSGRDVSRIERNRENGILASQQQARASFGEINGQLLSSAGKTISGAYIGASDATDVYNAKHPKKTVD